MVSKCKKCKASLADGKVSVVEGGVCYSFCKPCADILAFLPTQSIQSFLYDKKESWVGKNMREARERRARGESLWESVG